MQFFRTRSLMLFYRQLGQLTGSGVNIVEALDIISRQGGSGELDRAVSGIKDELAAGVSLGEAFSRFPLVFPPLHVNIIKYSETSGRLSAGITSLADYLEKEYDAQQSIMAGLAYPVIILHVAMFLLPVINAVSCGGCGYLRGFLGIFIPVYGLAGLVYFILRQGRSSRFKAGFDSFVLGLPVAGGLVRRFAISRFVRALQVLSSSGVSIISSWKTAAESCGNDAVSASLLSGLPLLQDGQGVSQAFIKSGVFPASMVGLITSAEKSGSIVQTLNTMAVYAEKENQAAVAMLTKIIPVIVYLLIAGFIGLKIISFYLGYFSRVFSFSG